MSIYNLILVILLCLGAPPLSHGAASVARSFAPGFKIGIIWQFIHNIGRIIGSAKAVLRITALHPAKIIPQYNFTITSVMIGITGAYIEVHYARRILINDNYGGKYDGFAWRE